MKEKYESELQAIRDETNQKFNQLMVLIQKNPKLVNIKPEVLVKDNKTSQI